MYFRSHFCIYSHHTAKMNNISHTARKINAPEFIEIVQSELLHEKNVEIFREQNSSWKIFFGKFWLEKIPKNKSEKIQKKAERNFPEIPKQIFPRRIFRSFSEPKNSNFSCVNTTKYREKKLNTVIPVQNNLKTIFSHRTYYWSPDCCSSVYVIGRKSIKNRWVLCWVLSEYSWVLSRWGFRTWFFLAY